MKLIKFILVLIIVILVSSIIFAVLSNSASAPTENLPILGANFFNHNQKIENQVSFDLTSVAEDDQSIEAVSYMLIDLSGDKVLSERRSEESLPIASLTKLMTVWTVLKFGNPDDNYTITSNDVEPINPSLGLQPGQVVKVKDLITSVLVGSTNDGALALSHYTEQKYSKSNDAKTSFIELMNQTAKELEMTSTRYANPIGFDNVSNYSSAQDIYRLVKAMLAKKVFEQTWKKSSFSFTGISGSSFSTSATNKLAAQYSDLFAIKTGYTNEALGSMVNLVKRDHDYLLIVIGSANRESDTLKLRSQLP
ncbi:MAG: serine hydrolase [Candidatus Doudnabacteria bacterium]